MATDNIRAFPLSWPFGWQRTPAYERGKPPYKVAFSNALKRLLDQLRLLGAEDVVVSTNLPLTTKGMPGADDRLMDDPGVAVYFNLKGRAQCMACDKWRFIKDNIRGVGLAIEALRQLERCGASDFLDRAFTGFTALPPPQTHRDWRDVLGYGDAPMLRTSIDTAYKFARSKAHPDKGGSAEAYDEVEKAYERALTELKDCGL